MIVTAPLTDSGSEGSHDLLRLWLNECYTSHERCWKTLSGGSISRLIDPALPTRVIDVGSDENSLAPRLIETAGKSARYVALSHRWGTGRSIPCTTQCTLQRHLNSIDLDSLSQTFKDAIAVTRGIGLRYLWIDSLCIIQDDNTDWERESYNMGSIYQNAYLVIRASTIDKSVDGLFHQRRIYLDVELSFINSSGQAEGSFFITASHQLNRGSPLLMNSALRARAWAVQEWILSRRMAHYTEAQLIWSCQESIKTEMNIPTSAVTRGSDWDEILFRYTECEITKRSDRLIALQGIANEIQKGRHDTYVQGLWTGNLPLQLSWIRLSSRHLERNADLPGTPSWS